MPRFDGPVEHLAEARIGRSGKAHIDDAGAVLGRPVDALDDVEGGALAAVRARIERPHRQHADARCHAEHVAPRRDRAGHAGAVRMRRRGVAVRAVGGRGMSKLRTTAPARSWMRSVDAGIDHRHQHAVAGRELVRLREVEPLRRILVGIHLRDLLLRQREQVVRLRAGDLRLARHAADHVAARWCRRRSASETAVRPVRRKVCVSMRVIAWRAGDRIELGLRHARRDVEDHLVGHDRRAPGGGRLNPFARGRRGGLRRSSLPAPALPAPPPGGGRLTGWIGGGSDGGGSGGSPRSGVGNSRDAMKAPSAAAAMPPTTYQTVVVVGIADGPG